MIKKSQSGHHEPDVLWGELGIDASLGLAPVLYDPPTSKVKE